MNSKAPDHSLSSLPVEEGRALPVRAAKHPARRMAGPYGHPFHPMLVTVPIGAWVTSVVFDVVAQAKANGAPGLFEGAYWAIGFGVVGAIVAAAFGAIDFATIPRGTRAYRVAAAHLILNVIVTTLFAVGWFSRVAGGRASASSGQFVLSVVALGILGLSGWLGGKLSYRYGVRVADEETQREGFGPQLQEPMSS